MRVGCVLQTKLPAAEGGDDAPTDLGAAARGAGSSSSESSRSEPKISACSALLSAIRAKSTNGVGVCARERVRAARCCASL